MKFGSLKRGGRDGTLVVLDRALSHAVIVQDIAPTMQHLLENWAACEEPLEAISKALNDATLTNAFTVAPDDFASPLPRSYQFLDGSVYLSHMQKARKARGAAMPTDFASVPLMYQGMSDRFYAPTEPVRMNSEADEIDLEAEIAVIVDDVPQGITPRAASAHIKLIMLLNDWSLRALTRSEVPRGFGFVQSKPASACSPAAVTPDELGAAWDGRKVSLPLLSSINGRRFGQPDAGRDMYFDYAELIAHAARTRPLSAGTIIGAGTVSNRDNTCGYGCIAEARTDEELQLGASRTPFLRFGDVVRIELLDGQGHTVFGAIEQTVAQMRSG